MQNGMLILQLILKRGRIRDNKVQNCTYLPYLATMIQTKIPKCRYFVVPAFIPTTLVS